MNVCIYIYNVLWTDFWERVGYRKTKREKLVSFSILCKGVGILSVIEISEKFLEGPEGKEVSDFSSSNEESPKLG